MKPVRVLMYSDYKLCGTIQGWSVNASVLVPSVTQQIVRRHERSQHS